MNIESACGMFQLISAVQFLNTKQELSREEKSWARLYMPQKLIRLKSGWLLPVNLKGMPLGQNETGKLLVDLEFLQGTAIQPENLNIEVLDDKLRLFTTNYPWGDVKHFREYRYRLNDLVGNPGVGVNVFG